MFSLMCSYDTSLNNIVCNYYMLCMLLLFLMFTVRGVPIDRLFAAAICRGDSAESSLLCQ